MLEFRNIQELFTLILWGIKYSRNAFLLFISIHEKGGESNLRMEMRLEILSEVESFSREKVGQNRTWRKSRILYVKRAAKGRKWEIKNIYYSCAYFIIFERKCEISFFYVFLFYSTDTYKLIQTKNKSRKKELYPKLSLFDVNRFYLFVSLYLSEYRKSVAGFCLKSKNDFFVLCWKIYHAVQNIIYLLWHPFTWLSSNIFYLLCDL